MVYIAPRRLVVAALLAWGIFGGMAVLVIGRGDAPFDAPVLQNLRRHAMDTAALAAALFFVLPDQPPRWAASLFALGVGWARLHLSVHFPSDVLAGWGAGAGWVLLVQLWAS